MKKNLLLISGILCSAVSLQAAAPEGNLYILGLNGDTTPSEANLLVLGERDEDDIDEGIWRWSLPEVNLTAAEGTVTVSDGASFSLGFDEDNQFGFTNDLTSSQSMIYMAQDGPAIKYNLSEGSYQVMVALFEDVEGDMGGDTWILQIKSLNSEEPTEQLYLLGFNDYTEPSAACCFQKIEYTEDGETYFIYSLPRYFVSECEEGFTVYNAGQDVTLGQDETFASMGDVTDENPMAFLGADGAPVKCSLKEGYYDVNLTMAGAMTMISFMICEDQTPQDELAYYLVGVNGIQTPDEAYKFDRQEITEEYEDEDTGETESYTSLIYVLKDVEIKEAAELTVAAQDNVYVFGYNPDLSAFLPNDFSNTMPFSSLAVGGEALKCSLEAGKYNFNFSISNVNTGMLAATPVEDDAVDSITAISGTPVYYNLQGARVANPENGIFIKVQDGKTTKVIK
ncbi:MAG: hypothetical protein K2L11_09735 [Muribaculaceae bacterium]|nr:hypothetical protein [Muribaculaceae bacterium]